MRRFDAIVIGGGLVGSAIAYGLANAGLRPALIDEGGKPVQASDIEGVIDPAYTKPGGKRSK